MSKCPICKNEPCVCQEHIHAKCQKEINDLRIRLADAQARAERAEVALNKVWELGEMGYLTTDFLPDVECGECGAKAASRDLVEHEDHCIQGVIANVLTPAQQEMTDKQLLDGLRQLCGYIEAGEGESITIGQDDATKVWVLHVGKTRWWHAKTFRGVIEAALKTPYAGSTENPR